MHYIVVIVTPYGAPIVRIAYSKDEANAVVEHEGGLTHREFKYYFYRARGTTAIYIQSNSLLNEYS